MFGIVILLCCALVVAVFLRYADRNAFETTIANMLTEHREMMKRAEEVSRTIAMMHGGSIRREKLASAALVEIRRIQLSEKHEAIGAILDKHGHDLARQLVERSLVDVVALTRAREIVASEKATYESSHSTEAQPQ